MKKFLFYIIITPMLWACGQPTVSDYIRNNPPYSFNTYDDYSVLKWWLNADEAYAVADAFYSDSSGSDVSWSEAISALQNATWSDYERLWYTFNTYYASILKTGGEYYIQPFSNENVYVESESILNVCQWLDSIYSKLCEIEGKMWDAGVGSVSKEISVPAPEGLYYLNEYSQSVQLYSLALSSAEIDLSQCSREISLELQYGNQKIYLTINETVYNIASQVLYEYDYMKSTIDEALTYDSRKEDFANSIY